MKIQVNWCFKQQANRRCFDQLQSILYRWQLHAQVCLLFLNEHKPSFSNHFSFKTCAIISISQGKVNFIIQTKNLKGESSKSARKTAKVKQNRWLVMSLHQLYNRAVSTAILLLCTVYWTFLLCLQFCFPFLLYESRFCRFSLNFASLVFYLSEKVTCQ